MGSRWSSLERKLRQQHGDATLIAGVDEVGRGPLAGPVVACAAIMPPSSTRRAIAGVDDSKQLTEEERERLAVRIRRDAEWNVPEPEVTLVINSHLELVGFTVGNDMSSRDIEGDNPLYLPQAKVYDACCGLGPCVTLAATMPDREETGIELVVRRGGNVAFEAKTSAGQMARTYEELISWLGREASFPNGVLLLTGTGIVPDSEYERRLAEVSEVLAELRDVDGRPILTNLVRGRDAYHGPYAQLGPDLHLELDHYAMIACPLFATEGRVMTSQIRGDSGCHRKEGIFIAGGPAFRSGLTLPEVDILDLAPTILQILDQLVPRIMDGRVLSEALVDPAPVRFSDETEGDIVAEQGFSSSESEQIEGRLRGLGYL